MVQLASALDTLNSVIDSRAIVATLLAAVVSAAAGLWWRRRHQARDITWSVLYDERINQGQNVDEDPADPADPSQNLWEIIANGAQIHDGSLVLLKVRQTGTEAIESTHWERKLTFTFKNRKVRGYKVREHDGLHAAVGNPAPSGTHKLELPKFLFNPDADFKLLVLLEGNGDEVKAGADIVNGRVLRHDKLPHPYRWIALAVAVALLVVGITTGAQVANTALTPAAKCATGQLTLRGSTAFAPVANQVRNSYRQLCGDSADITIEADGSENGLAALEHSHSTGTIALTDGLPATAGADSGLVRRPLGVVTYAVVANVRLGTVLPDLLRPDGISADELRLLFSATGDPSRNVVAVGRTAASGTRVAFADAFFHGTDPEPAGPHACRPGATRGFCTVDSTMDLLSYVNANPDAIGYAEADALPYFPGVQVIAVDGQTPSAAGVKDGSYPFVATEYVFTAGQPAGLTAAYLAFLTSDAETAALRGHGFLACSDLAGAKANGNCA